MASGWRWVVRCFWACVRARWSVVEVRVRRSSIYSWRRRECSRSLYGWLCQLGKRFVCCYCIFRRPVDRMKLGRNSMMMESISVKTNRDRLTPIFFNAALLSPHQAKHSPVLPSSKLLSIFLAATNSSISTNGSIPFAFAKLFALSSYPHRSR